MIYGRKAIYAGSFDPLTKGHIWVIEEGLRLFDHLYIAVGVNPAKKGYFTPMERLDMITEYLVKQGFTSLATPLLFDGEFLVDVAEKLDCQFMLRGIRNAKDFEYELEIKSFNDKLKPSIGTVFVVPPPKLAGVSSSIIRGTVGIKGWESAIKDYTTSHVIKQLKKRTNQAG
jgi:pantetheine-phosphate adenylyltransferase